VDRQAPLHCAFILCTEVREHIETKTFCYRNQVLMMMTPHQIVVVTQMAPVTQVTQETTMRIMILVIHHQVTQIQIECIWVSSVKFT